MLMLLFRHGFSTAHAIGKQLQPFVIAAVKTIISRIYGHDVKDEPSEEGNAVQHALSLALSPLQTVPDDVLLEIFKCHRPAVIECDLWKWHRLAQVCRKWRSMVFAYPRHLDLRIVSTYDKPIRKAPTFWPVLPIILWYPHPPTAFHPILTLNDFYNMFDLLKDPARLREIDIVITQPQIARFASSLKESLPALDYLRLRSREGGTIDTMVLPNNFLNGSAPQLRVLHLQGTVIPMLPRLLLSSKNLITLRLEDITRGRYFMAEDLVVGLSTATQLKFLELSFYPVATIIPFSQKLGPSPLSPRIVLPSLTDFRYEGESAYLRYFVSRIDTPIIERICVSFLYDSKYDNHKLCELFGLGDMLRSSPTHIRLSTDHMVFSHHFARVPSLPGLFRLKLPYRTRQPIPPLVAQVCVGLESQDVLPNVVHLEIEDCPYRFNERFPACCFDLLRTLTGLKTLYVVGKLASVIASALARFNGETTREILPALQELHFGPETLSSTPTSIEPFITERQLCGLPVSVHFAKLNWVHDRWGERRL